MANPSDQDAALLSFRQAANFRSVTRNDPSVTEIIETSVYSTIYHYDDQGNWEKQKMEGSTFIVHRYVTSSPCHLVTLPARFTVIYHVLSIRCNRAEWLLSGTSLRNTRYTCSTGRR